MAENNQSPNQEQEPKQKSNRSIFYIILIIILVLINGYLYFKNRQSSQVVSNQTQTLNTDSAHIADLDARYHSEMDSLYSYKGQNATLDSLLKIKITQLAGMERNLDVAKKTGKLEETEYKKNLDSLTDMVKDLQGQIADLQKQNGILIQKNDSLGKSLEASEGNNQQLTQQNTELGSKLIKASLLVPQNIVGEGIKVSSSGKEKTTASNKKAKKIKVAFDIPANNTIDAGDKTFYLVLTDPKGAVLTDQSQGSGVFKIAETTNQQQYTASKTVSYNQQKQHVEIEWTSATGFDEGDYIAEVYQDGYLTGKGTIKLK